MPLFYPLSLVEALSPCVLQTGLCSQNKNLWLRLFYYWHLLLWQVIKWLFSLFTYSDSDTTTLTPQPWLQSNITGADCTSKHSVHFVQWLVTCAESALGLRGLFGFAEAKAMFYEKMPFVQSIKWLVFRRESNHWNKTKTETLEEGMVLQPVGYCWIIQSMLAWNVDIKRYW